MRGRVVVGGLVTLALVVAGVALTVLLGLPGDGDDGVDVLDTLYYEVLYDDEATAEDVVEAAEAPSDLAESDDGTTYALFAIRDQEGGDAAKAAVTVRSPNGGLVASRSVPPLGEVESAGDHAVLLGDAGTVTTIDPDGELVPVTRESTDADGMIVLDGVRPADGVEPGDVTADAESALLYRPSTRTVHEVPLPDQDPDTVPTVLVGDGRIWVVDQTEGSVVVRTSTDGSDWDRVAYASDVFPVSTALHDDALALVELADDGGGFATRAVHVVEDGSERSVEVPDGLGEGAVGWTPDGRVLLGVEGAWWRERDGVLEPLDSPGRVSTTRVVGDRLVAFGDREAWSSTDAGDTWTDLEP